MSADPIQLSGAALSFAEEEAQREGTSVSHWLSQELEHRHMVKQQTEAFFQERRARAIPGAFDEFLNSLPEAPPMPGDEWDGSSKPVAASPDIVQLPESILRHAEAQSQREGITKEEWIRRMTELRLDTDEGAREFFRQRAKGATGEGLKKWLDSVPDAPPMPGDELE